MFRRLRAFLRRLVPAPQRRRSVWSALVELAGYGLLTASAARVSVTLGIAVAGAFLVLIGYALAPRGGPR